VKTISIAPITRLEGHGKVEIFLNPQGEVDRAYLQIPELRGFEKFCEGRPVEEIPRIVPRICGVCPTAHHMASAKAVDDVFGVQPTPTARKLRELIYSAFMCEDHLLHFYFLGGPDFIVGPQAEPGSRNILGVVAKVGKEIAGRVIETRRLCREIVQTLGGKVIHPVCGLPGGVSRGMSVQERARFTGYAATVLEFCRFSLQVFDQIVLQNQAYRSLILGDAYRHDTYYMGLVDQNDKASFYDGQVRVVDPRGNLFAKFGPHEYLDHIAEHVEPWSYMKFTFLRKIGWKGFCDGVESGIYSVAPLARLNASTGLTTPLAQAEHDRMYDVLGGKPSGCTLAFHWARLIEALYAAEHLQELLADPDITGTDLRNIPAHGAVRAGVGIVEAPRGTLIHHYEADSNGLATKVNLIVATQNNAARIALSIDKAAKAMVHDGRADQGILNLVEMAFRAYDPCMACATHALPGEFPLVVNLRDEDGRLRQQLVQGSS
jgi:F420-non-reducing hydrogenase large subunit